MFHMRSSLFIALVAFFLFSFFGASRAQQVDIRIAFLYGNLPNDLSWVYAADLARFFVEFSRPNVKTTYAVVPYVCGNETIATMRKFAQNNYTLIITASSAYEECTLQVSREYPSTYFLTLGGGKAENNYASAFGRMYEGRWVAGVISGLMTRTKVLGFIGAIPIYQGFSDANALLLGARTVCPDCKVVHYYCGDFFKPAEDAYAAELLITQHNADVIHVLQDAFDHIGVATSYGVPVFGVDAPQNSIAPETIVTSVYWNWGPMLLRYVDSILTKTWASEFLYWGFRENGLGISALNTAFDTPQTSSRIATEISRMINNEFIGNTSYVFCGSTWASLAPSGTPACLTETDITAMNYFISGIEDHGFITLPTPPEKKSFAKWKIAVIVVCSVLGIALIAVVAVWMFRRFFHVLIISKTEKGGDEW